MSRSLYFAYGSNLNPYQMAKRCPGATFLGVGTLEGFALQERLYADVQEDDQEETWGALWALSRKNENALDAHEGVSRGVYGKWEVPVWIPAQETTLDALVYIMEPRTVRKREGRPFPQWYRERCLWGARWAEIPVPALYEPSRKPRSGRRRSLIDLELERVRQKRNALQRA